MERKDKTDLRLMKIWGSAKYYQDKWNHYQVKYSDFVSYEGERLSREEIWKKRFSGGSVEVDHIRKGIFFNERDHVESEIIRIKQLYELLKADPELFADVQYKRPIESYKEYLNKKLKTLKKLNPKPPSERVKSYLIYLMRINGKLQFEYPTGKDAKAEIRKFLNKNNWTYADRIVSESVEKDNIFHNIPDDKKFEEIEQATALYKSIFNETPVGE